MRTPPPPLLPLLRSRIQADVLALLYLHPDREYSITDLARHIEASSKAVQQEVDRLVTAGYLTDRRLGTSRLIRSVQGSLITRPLTDLLAVTHGPLPVLAEILSPIPGIDEAMIYGSWAARYSGEPGPIPHDIDVLVVGEVDLDDLDDAAREAETILHREVNIRRLRSSLWTTGNDPFANTVLSRPMVPIGITGDDGSRSRHDVAAGKTPDRPDAGGRGTGASAT